MSKFVKVIVLSTLLIAPISSFAACQKLTRTITPNMKGEDVKALQKYLNNNADTVIAKSGKNSKGNESGVYDLDTQKAFKKFQTLNSDKILKPAGLKAPNGIVGSASRNIINNSICPTTISPSINTNMSDKEAMAQIEAYNKKINESLKKIDNVMAAKKTKKTDISKEKAKDLDNIQNKVDTLNKKSITPEEYARLISDEMNKTVKQTDITLHGIIPEDIRQGDTIYLFGDKLEKVNKIYFGNKVVIATKVQNNDRFVPVIVPVELQPGKYDIYYENVNGKSSKLNAQIRAKATSASNVQITSITPTSGNNGTEVTITGYGFSKSNTVLTTTRIFKNVPSVDGKTIKIKIEAETGMLDADKKILKALPFNIIVRNESGESNIVDFKIE